MDQREIHDILGSNSDSSGFQHFVWNCFHLWLVTNIHKLHLSEWGRSKPSTNQLLTARSRIQPPHLCSEALRHKPHAIPSGSELLRPPRQSEAPHSSVARGLEVVSRVSAYDSKVTSSTALLSPGVLSWTCGHSWGKNWKHCIINGQLISRISMNIWCIHGHMCTGCKSFVAGNPWCAAGFSPVPRCLLSCHGSPLDLWWSPWRP